MSTLLSEARVKVNKAYRLAGMGYEIDHLLDLKQLKEVGGNVGSNIEPRSDGQVKEILEEVKEDDSRPETPRMSQDELNKLRDDLDRLQSQYIYDPNDGDMSDANIWATGPYVAAYGQNPDTAVAAAPAIDVGYTTLPAYEFIDAVMTVTKTADPNMVAAATLQESTFTLLVESLDYTVDDISVIDTLPVDWEYMSGTATITLADKSTLTGAAADPDDITGRKLTWDETTLGSMGENQDIKIVYKARTTAASSFSAGDISRNVVESIGTRTIQGVVQTFSSTDFVLPRKLFFLIF